MDLNRVQGLDDKSRERLVRAVRRRLDSSGRLIATSQRSRDQSRNLEDARRKISDWIARALIPEKKRVPTHPGRKAREQRLNLKRRTSRRKQDRRLDSSDQD